MQECHWNCFLQPKQDHLCPKKSKNSKYLCDEKILDIGVDKDAFEEIIENGWIDMKGTDIN